MGMNGIRLIREWFLEGYNKEYFDTYRSEIERYNTGILTFFNALVLSLLVFVFV